VGAEPPLKQLATDLVAHIEQPSRTQPAKAIVVAMKKESSHAAFWSFCASRVIGVAHKGNDAEQKRSKNRTETRSSPQTSKTGV